MDVSGLKKRGQGLRFQILKNWIDGYGNGWFQIRTNVVVGSLCLGSLILLYTLKGSILDPQNYFQLFLRDMVTDTERGQELVTCDATSTSSIQRSFGLGVALVIERIATLYFFP